MKIQGRNERSQDHTNATISTGVVTDDISLNDDKNLRGHKRPISHKAYLCARANSKLSTMETWLTLRLNPQHECISILHMVWTHFMKTKSGNTSSVLSPTARPIGSTLNDETVSVQV